MTERLNTELPPKVSYRQDQVVAGAKRRQLAEGWYRARCTSNSAQVSKNSGNIMFVQQFTILDDDGEPSTQSVRNYLTTPFDNPNIQGHEGPTKIVGLVHGTLLALGYGDLPDYPRRVDGALVFDGEEISPEENESSRQTVVAATLEALMELYEDPAGLLGHEAFVEIEQDGDFNRINRFRAELPEDVELVPQKDWFKEAATENGTNGRG